jgi:hypothetical protein
MTIYEKIIEISNRLRVGKDGSNRGFKYFKPDDINEAINPSLKEFKMIAIFKMPFSPTKGMYEGNLLLIDYEATETMPKSVEYTFDIPKTSVPGASEAQNAGATLTYCKRYMTMSAFNLADNAADPDAQEPPKDDKAFRALVENAKKAINAKGLKDAIVKMEKTTKYTPEQKKEYIDAANETIKRLEKK